jgi:N-acetylneuraminate synthase
MNISKLLKKIVRAVRGPAQGTKTVHIGDVPVGKNHFGYIIAEIGINHNGDMAIAKQLIDASADAGCQAVKLQKRTIEDVYTKEELDKPRAVDVAVLKNAVARDVLSKEAVDRLTKSDFKDSTNGDLKYALEFTTDEYRLLKEYSNAKGLHFFASPWDLKSGCSCA